jgi:TPR repeat protein
METRSSKLWMCLSWLAACIALAATARAGDDTARFYGTWQATFPYNSQMITMLSVHDEGGYKNYVVAATGNVPAGDGTFQAANGKYTTSAPAPNNAGIYHFIGANTVVCTNAAGQTLTWKRYNGPTPMAAAPSPATPSPAASPQPAAQPAPPALAPDPSLPPETNAAIAAFGRKDYNTAWREFMIAAQKGDSEAQAGIGAMLLTHINPPGTGYWAQCEKWLLLSAKQGNTKGMTFLAKFYYTDGVNIAGGINPGVNNTPIPPALRTQAERRFAQAREWYEKAADKNDGYAMGALAIMLDAGVGGPRDPARAAQLRAGVAARTDPNFAKKATGDPASLAMTAAWQSGHYQDALKAARELADKGNPAAESVIDRSYYTGVGSPQSYAAALAWFQKAAAQKNPDALFFLGLMYEWGHGVRQDLQKAVSLLDQAAALGQRQAEMEAAGMRMEGEAAAQQARYAAVCQKAGGVTDGPLCLVGGMAIDPY